MQLTTKMLKLPITILAVLIAGVIFNEITCERKVEAQEKPKPEFVRGFEAGVRYGLITYLSDPTESDIPTITENAKKWYYLIVVDEGKTLIDGVNKKIEVKK